MNEDHYRVMLVDDEPNVLSALRRVLAAPVRYEGRDYRLRVETFDSPAAALERARDGVPFDLVISDYRMPGMDGVAFLKAFMEIQPDAARLILSGYADLDGLIGAINEARIFRFLSKPWHDFDVTSAAAQALAYRTLLLENRRLADAVRVARGHIRPEDYERQRLEEESPGITKVNWGPDGSVLLDPEE